MRWHWRLPGRWMAVVAIAGVCLAAPAARAARTPDSAVTPTENLPRRVDQIQASLKGLDPKVAFVGDSITQYWISTGKEVWKSYDKYHAADLGVSGDCTENVLWRITTGGELETIHPKVIVLLIGTNNVGRGHPDEKVQWAAAGVKKVLDTLQAKLPESKILLLAVFPRQEKDSVFRARVAALNDLIKPFADGDKIRFLDIGSVFLDANGEIPVDVMKDGLHPTAKGYALWRDAMQPTLDEMLK